MNSEVSSKAVSANSVSSKRASNFRRIFEIIIRFILVVFFFLKPFLLFPLSPWNVLFIYLISLLVSKVGGAVFGFLLLLRFLQGTVRLNVDVANWLLVKTRSILFHNSSHHRAKTGRHKKKRLYSQISFDRLEGGISAIDTVGELLKENSTLGRQDPVSHILEKIYIADLGTVKNHFEGSPDPQSYGESRWFLRMSEANSIIQQETANSAFWGFRNPLHYLPGNIGISTSEKSCLFDYSTPFLSGNLLLVADSIARDGDYVGCRLKLECHFRKPLYLEDLKVGIFCNSPWDLSAKQLLLIEGAKRVIPDLEIQTQGNFSVTIPLANFATAICIKKKSDTPLDIASQNIPEETGIYLPGRKLCLVKKLCCKCFNKPKRVLLPSNRVVYVTLPLPIFPCTASTFFGQIPLFKTLSEYISPMQPTQLFLFEGSGAKNVFFSLQCYKRK